MRKYKTGAYEDIDIESFLDFHNIEYKTSGKNVGQDWISICCPFCGENRFHCGINLNSKVASCWVCGESVTCLGLVASLLNCDWRTAKSALSTFGGHYQEIREPVFAKEVIYPTRLTEITANGRKYLANRGFDPKEIIKKYKIMESGILSKLEIGEKSWDFKNRIVIPIIMDRQEVSYTARDWTGLSGTRYKNAPSAAGSSPMAECLYNIDNAKQKVILVEGPSDVWRIGGSSIATMGVKTTSEQIQRIVAKKFKKLVILFDEGASKPATKLANILTPFINEVTVFTLTDSDPGGLTIEEATKLRFQLIGE